MNSPQPFSLRIFVADGDPDGLRLVERSNWIGKALVFPRKLYPEVRSRSEFQQTGVLARNVHASSDGWCTALRGRSREQDFPTSGLVSKTAAVLPLVRIERFGPVQPTRRVFGHDGRKSRERSGLVRTANGRIEWKRADGKTLKQLQEVQAFA